MKKRIFGAPVIPPAPEDESDQEFQPNYTRGNNKKKTNINPFELLQAENNGKASENISENVSGKDSDEYESEGNAVACVQKKKRKKKKKTKTQKKATAPVDKDSDDDVDEVVRQVNAILGTPPEVAATSCTDADPAATLPPHMAVQNKFLNVVIEVQKKFSTNLIKEDNPKPKSKDQWSKKTILTYYKEGWTPVWNTDMQMSMIANENGIKYFVFKHKDTYQQVQCQYFRLLRDVRADFDPVEQIFLKTLPYHIDSLLLRSFRLGYFKKYKESRECIEQAIYALEHVLHRSFNFHSGACRLLYKHYENRCFHILMLRYVRCHYNLACHRTALEICKLLLSLDPSDPLAIILVIDSVALRAKEFMWLVTAIKHWELEWQALHHPNLAFSFALSHYCIALKRRESTDEADELLKNAIRRFPGAVIDLLKKCGSTKLQTIQSLPYYEEERRRDLKVLKALTFLLAQRQWPVWKWPENLSWLEKVAAEVGRELKDKALMDWRYDSFRRAPRELLRHLAVLDNSQVQDLDHSDSVPCPTDPYPPHNGVSSYKESVYESPETDLREGWRRYTVRAGIE